MVPKIAFEWMALLIMLIVIHDLVHVTAPAVVLAYLNSQVRLKTTGY
jgi:hypothetical protein